MHDTSINQLIIDALRAEVEWVRTDRDFQTRARELLERDARIVQALGSSDEPASSRSPARAGKRDAPTHCRS